MGKKEIINIIRSIKPEMESRYGVQRLGLFGSYVRERQRQKSDIDILVLLHQPFSYFEETQRIIDLLYPIQLESEHLISAKPVFLQDYERGRFQLYRTAKKEGLVV